MSNNHAGAAIRDITYRGDGIPDAACLKRDFSHEMGQLRRGSGIIRDRNARCRARYAAVLGFTPLVHYYLLILCSS